MMSPSVCGIHGAQSVRAATQGYTNTTATTPTTTRRPMEYCSCPTANRDRAIPEQGSLASQERGAGAGFRPARPVGCMRGLGAPRRDLRLPLLVDEHQEVGGDHRRSELAEQDDHLASMVAGMIH